MMDLAQLKKLERANTGLCFRFTGKSLAVHDCWSGFAQCAWR